MNKQALIAELKLLSDKPGQVVADEVTRPFLELARTMGLARPHRAQAMRFVTNRTPRHVELFGQLIPVQGALYDVWELQGEALQ